MTVRYLRPGLLLLLSVVPFFAGCGGRKFYPVKGQVLVGGKPGAGVQVVFHPQEDAGPDAVRPTAVVQADGSFELSSWVVKDRVLHKGAPAGKYLVTCVLYPADLQKYLGNEVLPDKLGGRYALPKTSSLHAEVAEKPNELAPFTLESK